MDHLLSCLDLYFLFDKLVIINSTLKKTVEFFVFHLVFMLCGTQCCNSYLWHCQVTDAKTMIAILHWASPWTCYDLISCHLNACGLRGRQYGEQTLEEFLAHLVSNNDIRFRTEVLKTGPFPGSLLREIAFLKENFRSNGYTMWKMQKDFKNKSSNTMGKSALLQSFCHTLVKWHYILQAPKPEGTAFWTHHEFGRGLWQLFCEY